MIFLFFFDQISFCKKHYFILFFLFYLYIYPPDLKKSDGGAIHKASSYIDLLPEMPIYCCPVEIFCFGFLVLLRYD